MVPNTAQMFREGKAELLKLYGNRYLVFDSRGILLPQFFDALITIRNYKDFQRRLLRTMDDVSYIREGFFVAHNLEPSNKMKVWGLENHYVQNQLVDTIIYLTSDFDPVHIMAMSL